MEFSFIHTADIHLGRAFADIDYELSGAQKEILKNAHEKAFETLCDYAIEKNIDFILIAGDTFDACQHDLHSKLVLTSELKRLEKNGIEVYVVCGNHDPEFSYTNELAFKNSEKIHIFGVNSSLEPQIFTKNGEPAAKIYPFGFKTNECKESPCNTLEKSTSKTLFNIGLIHCDIMGDNNVYAPCSEKELSALDYDYYALGHIHKPYKNKNIIYPGTIQARSRKDEGEHGFVRVTVSNNQITNDEFITCDKVRYYNLNYNLTNDDSEIETTENIAAQINELSQGTPLVIINLTLSGICKYKKPSLDEFNSELTGANIIINEICDNSVTEVSKEEILTAGGVLSKILNISDDKNSLTNILKKTNEDISDVLKLTEAINEDEVITPAISILENICGEIYGKTEESDE